MLVRKKKVVEKPQVIQVKEEDGKVKKIGKYFPDKREFKTERLKSEHFMRKHNAWGLDAKVVEFLITKNAKVHLVDKESKWEYLADAGDFKVYGILEEHKPHRPQYFLPMKYWEILRAKNRTSVAECEFTECVHNFCNNCLRGVISLNKNGECNNYDERQDI